MNNSFFDVDLIMALLGGKVSMAISHKLVQNFRRNQIPLNSDQWLVLLYLRARDGVTQNFLCTQTYKEKVWMTRTLNSLVAAGLVLRRQGKEDKRENRIYLTVEGRELTERAYQVGNRTLMESLKGLGSGEIKTCQEVLRKVFENATE